MKIGLIGFTLVSLFSGNLNAEESYLCISDLAVGVTYRSGQPKIAHFPPNTFKLIVTKPDDPKKYTKTVAFVARPFGEESNMGSEMVCLEPFDESGHLFCKGLQGNFRMNKKSLKFATSSLTSFFTYFSDSEQHDDDYFSIGKCSPL